jgi:hypothetical protein
MSMMGMLSESRMMPLRWRWEALYRSLPYGQACRLAPAALLRKARRSLQTTVAPTVKRIVDGCREYA